MVTIKLDLPTTDLSLAYWAFPQILTLTIMICLGPFLARIVILSDSSAASQCHGTVRLHLFVASGRTSVGCTSRVVLHFQCT